VGFVAIVRGRAIGAAKPSCGVGFVAIVRGGAIGAAKPSCGVGFVAIVRGRAIVAAKPSCGVGFVACTPCRADECDEMHPRSPTETQFARARGAARATQRRNRGARI
jgi:hypothetical protein